MGRTLVREIIAAHSTQEAAEGEICRVKVDFAFANDITGAPAAASFREMGAEKVFDGERCAFLPDHFTPNKDIASAEQTKAGREFALEQGMLYWEVGRVGIEHAFLPEKGYILPGDIVIGADSHTCTGGALGALSTGVGSTDLAAVWALGETWMKVPPTIRVNFMGERPGWVTGKDMILSLIGRIGVQGARYMALEFGGRELTASQWTTASPSPTWRLRRGPKRGSLYRMKKHSPTPGRGQPGSSPPGTRKRGRPTSKQRHSISAK